MTKFTSPEQTTIIKLGGMNMDFIKAPENANDEVRKTIDGFTLQSKDGSEVYSFKTIDKGVYYPPDDKVDSLKK